MQLAHVDQDELAQRQGIRLPQAGFRKVRNVKGGILARSDKVDPTVPKY
jgi:rhodanese-related sulfurtransferase